MSNRKFASITGSLLARKGEASPSAEPSMPPEAWRKPAPVPEMRVERVEPARDMPVLSPSPIVATKAEMPHKIAMRLSEAQHLRLRVAAAQLQVTRQALLAAALDHYLTTVCTQGRPDCACLRSGGCGCAE